MVRRIIGLVAALVMVGGFQALTVTTASAHTKQIDVDCYGLSLVLDKYNSDDGRSNSVKVTIDGAVVTDEDFDNAFSKVYGWDETVAHSWKVQVEAWDDQGSDGHGWTFYKHGYSEPCIPYDQCPDLPGTQPEGYDCDPPPPPVTKNKHVKVRVQVVDECNCWRDSVRMIADRSKVRVKATHPSKTVWKFRVTGRKIQRQDGVSVQYLLPNAMRGNSGWAVSQWYKVKTTNKVCPCHRNHTCTPLPNPHDTCAAGIGRRGQVC